MSLHALWLFINSNPMIACMTARSTSVAAAAAAAPATASDAAPMTHKTDAGLAGTWNPLQQAASQRRFCGSHGTRSKVKRVMSNRASLPGAKPEPELLQVHAANWHRCSLFAAIGPNEIERCASARNKTDTRLKLQIRQVAVWNRLSRVNYSAGNLT